MKKIYYGLPLMVAGIFLAGCKAEVYTSVSYNFLKDEEVKHIPGHIVMEVTSCSDYEDSRKPSSALTELVQSMPQVFSGAEFVECYRSGMDSLARFSIPIAISRVWGEFSDTGTVNIFHGEEALLAMGVPPELRSRIENILQSNPMAPNIDMSFGFTFFNDSGGSLEASVLGAWVNNSPYVITRFEIEPYSEIEVDMSDVAMDYAYEGNFSAILLN